MLVLTRKVGQVIVIEGGIEICVGRIEGKKVRLAVTAPRHLRIERVETPRTGEKSRASETEDVG